jgi:C1A family cysteine protease
MLGFRPNLNKEQKNLHIFDSSLTDLPASINWVDQGKVSAVKDQGTCGSCWSFSTTGSIESANAIKNNQMVLFSEQQLVDCSQSYGNNGCSGGLVEYAYNYAKHVPLETEDQYPYHATNQKC